MLSCLAYSESSPSGLVWIKSRGNSVIGSKAGSFDDSCGYWRIGSKERALVHRVIWELEHGAIPEGYIVDHLDGNKLNNKLSNLRIIPFEHNAQNAGMYSNNTSGETGVSFNKGTSSWAATWWEDGKPKRKTFSVNKWGASAKDMAIAVRMQAIKRLKASGEAYTERHGL